MNIQGLIERYEKFKTSKKKMTSVDLVFERLEVFGRARTVAIQIKGCCWQN